MSLKTRIQALEKHFAPDGPTLPRLCTVYVDSKAPSLNPGPIKWGTVPGLAEVFERGPDESEDDFVARLIAMTGPERLTSVTIHAETLRPELPGTSSVGQWA